MSVLEALSVEEKYLIALLMDSSGVDAAEFLWKDPDQRDSLFRCYPFQIPWYRNDAKKQIDQCARAIGKSIGIQMRGFAFSFTNPGNEMLVTAPEMIHLDPVTKNIEDRLMSTRLSREMLKSASQSNGITHRPFEAKFRNGAKIIGRIPQKDGKGVKGMHPRVLEMDEAQDYPGPGWVELVETLRYGDDSSRWRAHGVSRGVRDHYYKISQSEDWFVHRLCMPAGTLVYGVDGPFEIQDAKVGTMVWSTTREGQLVQRPVTAVLNNGVKATWCVTAKGGLSLETTPNHPYLILSRDGTRRTRRVLSFEWVEAQNLRPGDYIVGCRELDSTGTIEPPVEVVSAMLSDHSPVREVPSWVWAAPRATQFAFLAGYSMADGTLTPNGWARTSSASRKLTQQIRALCRYLGLGVSNIHESQSPITGKPQYAVEWGVVNKDVRQIPLEYSEHDLGLDKRLVARCVQHSVTSGHVTPTYDITVDGLHNYLAEGIVTHNTAMHRPDWTAAERKSKAELYGSREHPDYRRNILGLHGDAMSSLFVLSRLMQCVDSNEVSDYNANIYTHIRINEEYLKDSGMQIEDLIDLPGSHKLFKRTWIGMDVGMTNHPSEILVFGEEGLPAKRTGEEGMGVRLKCLTRIHLERVSAMDQLRVMNHLCRFYRPQGFGMDRTGLGLPIFQYARDSTEAAPELMKAIRGYNFSEKIPVAFEELDDGEEWGDPMDRAIMGNVLEYSSDTLRLLVDQQRLRLPWDIDMLREFQGQAYYTVKSATSPYGRKEFNKGKFHALDAARMAALAFSQEHIDKMLNFQPEQEAIMLTWADAPIEAGGYADPMYSGW